MKRLFILLIVGMLTACNGGSNPSFPGVWRGSFDSVSTSCEFPVNGDLNPLFPMTINEEADGSISVRAADGSLAIGRQGERETISFSADSPHFGDFGSTRPFVCTSTSRVGYLGAGDDKAKVSVVILFDNCTLAGAEAAIESCSATYLGDATKD